MYLYDINVPSISSESILCFSHESTEILSFHPETKTFKELSITPDSPKDGINKIK